MKEFSVCERCLDVLCGLDKIPKLVIDSCSTHFKGQAIQILQLLGYYKGTGSETRIG